MAGRLVMSPELVLEMRSVDRSYRRGDEVVHALCDFSLTSGCW